MNRESAKDRITERISVRSLVEFIFRSGNLDNRRSTRADMDAMQKGSRLHRRIQGRMGANYRPEQTLVHTVDCGEYDIRLEGRADGILVEDGLVTIDEIKGVYLDVGSLEAPVYVHQAQAMCYAYIYGLQNGCERMGVRMTYGNLEAEEIRRFSLEFSMEELSEWFDQLIAAYRKWTDYMMEWRKVRSASMERLEFPFPYREGQRELVVGVYRSIARRKQLFIQAPTGVGKTMSVVFPAVRAVGEGLGDKIFYLTAKTITRTVAGEAFGILAERGLKYKVLTITAKEKLCACEEMNCNPAGCPRAQGHFDRVNDAVFEMLTSFDSFDREAISQQAEKWQVCPFEMCLDLSLWMDAVICDYNYVFDPNVRLQRFFGEGVKDDHIFLIDEAHNLVDRGREMYSAIVCKEDILEMKKQMKTVSTKITRSLEKVNRLLLEYKRECEEYRVLSNAGNLPVAFFNLQGEIEKFMEEHPDFDWPRESLECYFSVRSFLYIYDLLDENYVIYTELTQEGRFQIKLFCVNPAANLQSCLDKGAAAIFFSATLLPVNYFRSLLSARKDDYAVYARSPFSPQQKRLLVCRDVSSKYTRRGYAEYRRIADYVNRTVRARRGNYMIFFPSYRLMESVYEVFREEFLSDSEAEEIRCLCQTPRMGERAREEFLEQFRETRDGTLAAFCVMGGIFSEGIDLIGESLIGAVIVGTGIPQVSCEREILKDYYDRKQGSGFDYAYRIPGMNKVLQAAGRVIRTAEDSGVILLLDERFLHREYLQLFPREWEDYGVCVLHSVEKELENFWKLKQTEK